MLYYNFIYMLKTNLKITIAKLLSILCAKIIILLYYRIATTITYLLYFLLIV